MKLTHHETIGWCITEKSGSTLLSEFTKRERERRGLSVAEMTLIMGVSHPTYANFEKGRNRSMDVGLKALDALGYDTFILGGSVPQEGNTT